MTWRIAPAGDTGLLVSLGEEIGQHVLAQLLALDRQIVDRSLPGVVSTTPAYASLLVIFDPELTDPDALASSISAMEASLQPAALEGRLVEVGVWYDGPDLGSVAALARLSVDDVVAIHTGAEYPVYCVGFAPGFTYCGELPVALATSRLPTPRVRVPAGSVGIAGRQTGIYAVDSPGGWNLIGRTDFPLFDLGRRPPAFFKPGDRIRFRAHR